MKKLLTFLTLLTLFFGVGWAEEATFTLTNITSGTSVEWSGATVDDITVSASIGTGTTAPTYYSNGNAVRFYKNNTLTISGATITKIVFTSSNSTLGNFSTTTGSYSSGTWTGSASSIAFDVSAAARLTQIVVTYSSGSSTGPTAPTGTISFNPAAGAVSSGTEIEITFSGTCDGIKYTTDGTTNPDATHGTEYDPTNPPVINEAKTIKAAAYNTSNNEYAFGSVATASYTISAPSTPTSGEYVKVTTAGDLPSGEYLIVYENGNVAFNGNLGTLDAIGNTIPVTIANNKIEATSAVDAAVFTYNATEHSLMSHSGYYIGKSDYNNGLSQDENFGDDFVNNIAIDENGNAVITASGGCTMRYNNTSNQTRFRYYKSGQQAVQIYKKVEQTQSNDLYIIGHVNQYVPNDWTYTDGVKMTYDETTQTYSKNIYITGANKNEGYGWIQLSTALGPEQTLIDNNNLYGSGDLNGGAFWGLSETLDTDVALYRGSQTSYRLAPGLYTITADLNNGPSGNQYANGKIRAHQNTATISFSQPSGSELTSGSTVEITSTLAELSGSNAVVIEYSTDGGNTWTAGTTATLTASGTLKARAYIPGSSLEPTKEGMYLTVSEEATYTVVQKYSATIASGITGGSVAFNAAGTTTKLNDLPEGYEVRVYVTEGNNYELSSLSYTAEGSTTPVDITNNAGEYYTFNMPAANVTINATFTYNGPAVTTTTYEKITSLTDLEVNKKYLIVNEAGPYAYAGISKYGEEITITNGTTEIGSDSGVNQMTLSEGLTNGTYIFSFPYSGTTYYLTYSGTGSNSVSSTSSANGATAWEIDFDTNGNAKITDGGNYLRAYTSGGDFRVYSSQSNQTIQLYKEVGISDPKFSIPAGVFQNSDYPNGINVALTCATDGATIYYSTDGTNFSEYSRAINVTETTTIYAYATKDGKQSNTVSANYKFVDFLVSDVVFSPASGTYYGDQTCQMFSTSKGARIYYTTDGSDPVMNQGTTQLYTGEVAMPATGTYNFKAVAYIGTTPSEISTASYVISNTTDYVSPSQYDNPKLYSVAELNAVEVPTTEPYYTTSYYEMVNPVQVIYMSTYKQNGYQPEFCLVRDNTGYGMIYFGKQNTSHNNYSVFNMGDWIGGGYSGQVSNFYDPNQQVLSDTHPELGRSGSGKHIYNWVDEAMSNSAVLPEYLTIPEIKASDPTGAGNDYWGHYVHLRKNTIELVQSEDPGNYTTGQDKDGKWSGTITDENGQSIMYYDKFYLQIDKDWTTTSNDFTGHPNRTFDVYGFVACYKNVYQISPFAFAWIDKPVIDKETATYYEPQTVTLSSPEDPTATIWYKTDDMDDYAVYTEPFEVNSTTTVSWYATKQSQYNDELESLIGEITMTFEEIAKPVISPESNVYAIGESVDASIAYEEGKTVSPIAVILYTTDGSDPKTSETAQEYTIGTTTLHFTTTTTVRAITRVGNLYSAEADAKTYTFVKSNGIIYDLVTNVNQLTSNGVYVIVSKNYSEALSTTQNEANRGAAGVMFVENTDKARVYGNDDVAIFTLTSLTHGEDTGTERHFLMQTTNSSENGYLYVGSETNNTLLTEAEEDAMGNDVAVVSIDADGRAHIHFNYAGGDNRYLQYWNRERYFTTYKTEDADRAVYIYYKNATPLAVIEKEGSTVDGQNDYTIADELVVVWANPDQGRLWCKDQGNVSIAKTDIKDGQVDYMKEVGQQHGEWDQSNWVLLQFPEATPANGIADLLENAVGKYIEPATVSGKYVDSNNYTIEIAHAETYTLALKAGADTTKNVYCTANFLPGNLNINGGQGAAGIYHGQNANYFFMNPKIQEICSITFAEYAGENTFVVPYNDAQIDGAFTIDWSYNEGGPQSPGIGTAYRFVAVVNRTSGSNYLKGGQPSEQIVVYPLDFKASSELPTAINTVDVNGKAVKSVKYVNVAGMVSDKPFSGVNIVVTEYTDGSRSTTKMLRK